MTDITTTESTEITPYEAWLAGFENAVQYSLLNGRPFTPEEFTNPEINTNLDNFTIWHNVGIDDEQGIWTMIGSRMGTYMVVLTNWDYNLVNDERALNDLWDTVKDQVPQRTFETVGFELNTNLNLPSIVLDVNGSKFFKYHYQKLLSKLHTLEDNK